MVTLRPTTASSQKYKETQTYKEIDETIAWTMFNKYRDLSRRYLFFLSPVTSRDISLDIYPYWYKAERLWGSTKKFKLSAERKVKLFQVLMISF